MSFLRRNPILGIVTFVMLFMFLMFIRYMAPFGRLNLKKAEVVQGEVTVSHSDNQLLSLKGEWYFTPNAFVPFYRLDPAAFTKVPGVYTTSVENPPFGYGTYGVRINGLRPNTAYALYTGSILSASTVIVNGKSIISSGVPGTSPDTEQPQFKANPAVFTPRSDGTAEIIIYVSNYHNRKGGSKNFPILGLADDVRKGLFFNTILYSVNFSIIFGFALFFVLFYLYYKQESYLLWMGMFLIAIGLRGLSFEPHVLARIWSTIPWKLHFIFRHSTHPLPILFTTIAVAKKWKIVYRIPYVSIIGMCVVYVLVIIFAPVQFSSRLVNIAQIISVPIVVYDIAILVIAAKRKERGALWLLVAFLTPALFFVHDVLVTQWVIKGELLIQDGVTLTGLLFSLMLLDGYARAVKDIEQASDQRNVINKSLSRFVRKPLLRLLPRDSIFSVVPGDYVALDCPFFSLNIQEFSTVTKDLTARQVFDLLNIYFAEVLSIIKKRDGIITKHTGSELIAVFPKSADSALQCGIEIQQVLGAREISVEGTPPITASIGIGFTSSILGMAGDMQRMDNILISDNYRIAEFLQNSQKRYNASILISDGLFAMLDNPMAYRIRSIPHLSSPQEVQTLLFEVYDGDAPEVKKLKYRSQTILERAAHAFSDHDMPKALHYVDQALLIFPQDPLGQYYKKVIEEYVSKKLEQIF